MICTFPKILLRGDQIKDGNMGKMNYAYIILARKLKRKRPFGRRRHRWAGIAY